jgi:hypothetical protein
VESYGGVGFLVNGNVEWGTLALPDPAHPGDPPKTLAELDSDGDGRTNGEELLDPADAWRLGDPHPGTASLVRLPGLVDRPVVIRQVYASGGGTGAAYDRDFIELYNRSTASVSLAGWSLQSAPAIGGSFFGSSASALTPLPAISLLPGQSLLIAGAAGGGAGAALPSPDVIDATPLALAEAGGKLVLASTSTPLACNGTFPDLCTSFESVMMDFVGFGTADSYEGLAAAPAPSPGTALSRGRGGCTDINSNGSTLPQVVPDFTLSAPAPRNSLTPKGTCSPPSEPPAVSALGVTHSQLLLGLLAVGGACAAARRRRRPERRRTFFSGSHPRG